MIGEKIIFATSNKHKFEEARDIFQQHGRIIEQHVPTSPEIQDEDLENIARFSLLQEISYLNKPLFLEDAGIFIEELNGFPGPYSSYVQNSIGNSGILKLLLGVNNRAAFFRSVIAFCKPGEDPLFFNGITKGYIAQEVRGDRMFGYDPIFIPSEGNGKTFGEMNITEKNKFSHRGKSLNSFINWLTNERKF